MVNQCAVPQEPPRMVGKMLLERRLSWSKYKMTSWFIEFLWRNREESSIGISRRDIVQMWEGTENIDQRSALTEVASRPFPSWDNGNKSATFASVCYFKEQNCTECPKFDVWIKIHLNFLRPKHSRMDLYLLAVKRLRRNVRLQLVYKMTWKCLCYALRLTENRIGENMSKENSNMYTRRSEFHAVGLRRRWRIGIEIKI